MVVFEMDVYKVFKKGMLLQADSTIEHSVLSNPQCDAPAAPALLEEDNMNADIMPISEDPSTDFLPLLSVGY